jgi:hypothetical protein
VVLAFDHHGQLLTAAGWSFVDRDRMAYDAVMQGMTGFAVMQGSKAPGLKPGSPSDGNVRDSSPEMLNSLVVDKVTSCTHC